MDNTIMLRDETASPNPAETSQRYASSASADDAASVSQSTRIAVLHIFRDIIRTSLRHSHWIEGKSGITGAQLWALQEVRDHPGVRVGALADLMALHQSTVSNVVDKLETAKLIQKERTTLDQRIVQLHLTKAGEAMLDTSPSPARGLLSEALRTLPDGTVMELKDVMERLLEEINRLSDVCMVQSAENGADQDSKN